MRRLCFLGVFPKEQILTLSAICEAPLLFGNSFLVKINLIFVLSVIFARRGCDGMNNKNIMIALNVALLAFIVFAALGPTKFVPRTGLGWQVDHFTGYFVFTAMFCAVRRRTFAVGAAVAAFAVTLELAQGLTPDRLPDAMGAFYSALGVSAATLLTGFLKGSRTPLTGGLFLRPFSVRLRSGFALAFPFDRPPHRTKHIRFPIY